MLSDLCSKIWGRRSKPAQWLEGDWFAIVRGIANGQRVDGAALESLLLHHGKTRDDLQQDVQTYINRREWRATMTTGQQATEKINRLLEIAEAGKLAEKKLRDTMPDRIQRQIEEVLVELRQISQTAARDLAKLEGWRLGEYGVEYRKAIIAGRDDAMLPLQRRLAQLTEEGLNHE